MQRVDPVADRSRADHGRPREVTQDPRALAALAGALGVRQRPLEHLLHLGTPASGSSAPPPRASTRARGRRRRARARTPRSRAAATSQHSVDPSRRVDERALVGELDQHAGAGRLRLGRPGLLERCPQHPLGAPEVAALAERAAELEQYVRAPRRRLNSNCSADRGQQPRARVRVAPRQGSGGRRSPGARRPAPPAVGCRRPAGRARAGTGPPARGGSRGTRRTPRRAARPIRRTARAARCAAPSACCGRRRRGSGCGGSAAGPRRPASSDRAGSGPGAPACAGAGRPRDAPRPAAARRTAPGQNSRPITAARSMNARSPGPRRSSLAASRLWTVAGMSRS